MHEDHKLDITFMVSVEGNEMSHVLTLALVSLGLKESVVCWCKWGF